MRLQLIPVLIILLLTQFLAESSVGESCATSRELEDQCAAVCYPTVKPLLRYIEVCQRNVKLASQMQDKLQEQDIKLTQCKELLDLQLIYIQNSERLCKPNDILKESFNKVEQENSKLLKGAKELASSKYEIVSKSYEQLSEEFKNFKAIAEKKEKLARDVRNTAAQYERNLASCQEQLAECKPISFNLEFHKNY